MADENYIDFIKKDSNEGIEIKGKDMIKLNAPFVYLSDDTPLLTSAQDLAGAINELFQGGSGGGDEADADYEKWQNLIEPAENQAVFLVRVPNTAAKSITMTIGYAIDMYYEDTWTVDWGDGTSSTGYSRQGPVSHDYSAIGEYTVIFTSHMVNCNNSAAVTSLPTSRTSSNATLVMAKYGDLIHAESNLNGIALSSQECLRYVKLCDETVFRNSYFQSCRALRTIFFNGTIETVEYNMFTGCHSLDFSNLKFNILSIGEYAFNACYNLKKIEMPECNTIGKGAFGMCDGLRKAVFPKCYSVSEYAFQACYALNQAVFADNCTFGTDAFSNCYSLYPYPSDNT